jgi:hypothetical protein
MKNTSSVMDREAKNENVQRLSRFRELKMENDKLTVQVIFFIAAKITLQIVLKLFIE